MKIILLNTPTGKVICTSIGDAEIKTMNCTENVRVKVSNSEGDLLFDFDPLKSGFTSALRETREKLSKQMLVLEV